MSIDSTLKAAMMARKSSECLLKLVTIEHEDFDTIRLVNNTADIVSNGNTYEAYNFDLSLPAEKNDAMPVVTMKLENINRVVTEAVESADKMKPCTVTISVIRASSPNTVQRGPLIFSVKNVTYDATWATLKLAYEDIMNERYPEHDMGPNNFPGLF